MILPDLNLHEIWNNLKGKQIELFYDRTCGKYTVNTYTVKENGKSRAYNLSKFEKFITVSDARKYAANQTKAKEWKKLK